ncbi:hypothetical protein MIH18_11620 [Marinobacter sp. M3C]|jgi:hypothetical protein|uniref:hypothetical protein n=1 Tax=unclassified Marinobacter TaxID=83889 RepID=UPI00200C4391|nr:MULTISPECIES: hypothetical protein [unclassified Marinobacter]MCL1477950.1 hypothetical protein [Marinobacter sp.]MCL1480485.1 hypothetical protein [Marinobacter sp.]MCL1484583.1 hypothetical protein [Marinobacter sp.]MCL1487801.1 hypothetical protein [Marinobacter sp.]UQG56309.1 hypothetical protein MIH16_01140 [Marinobacter sp. M4C]
MKFIGIVVFALILSGCASSKPISFSPNKEYSVSVQSSVFDTVRIDNNDTTLFLDGKSIGFIRVEPVPEGASSAADFLNALRSSSESDTVTTKSLSFPAGFSGFAAKNRNYLTGYLFNERNSGSVLIFSFPEDEFDQIAETVSRGI